MKFQSWTEDGHLRAPVFLRLRDDIDPKTVRRARSRRRRIGGRADGADRRRPGAARRRTKTAFTLAVGPHRIKLTHLDRVYWPADPALKQPALTKRDLLRYFAQVSPYMLPHLADRPLTMIRMPDGIRGQRFFQKHWEQERPAFVETITVFSGHKDESTTTCCATTCRRCCGSRSRARSSSTSGIRARSRAPTRHRKSTDYASSLEALEASVLNYPDYVRVRHRPVHLFGQGSARATEPELNTVAFEKGKEVAFWLRELLQSMSLEAIVKTSGKTGLHVFVPIKRTIDFDAARAGVASWSAGT